MFVSLCDSQTLASKSYAQVCLCHDSYKPRKAHTHILLYVLSVLSLKKAPAVLIPKGNNKKIIICCGHIKILCIYFCCFVSFFSLCLSAYVSVHIFFCFYVSIRACWHCTMRYASDCWSSSFLYISTMLFNCCCLFSALCSWCVCCHPLPRNEQTKN